MHNMKKPLKCKNQISNCKITNKNSKINLKKFTTECTEKNKIHREHREKRILLF